MGRYDQPAHIARPADQIVPRFQHREVTLHLLVQQRLTLVCFLYDAVQHNPILDALQLYEGIVDNECDVTTAIDVDDRLRVDAAGVDHHGAAVQSAAAISGDLSLCNGGNQGGQSPCRAKDGRGTRR